jgi:hypothetical protein
MSSEKMRSDGRTHRPDESARNTEIPWFREARSEISEIFRKFGVTIFDSVNFCPAVLLHKGNFVPLLQKLTESVDLFFLCSMFVCVAACTRNDPTL